MKKNVCNRLQKIGDYQVVGMIASTENAHLYRAMECVDGREEKLPYVLKELKRDISETVTPEKEKNFTHHIEMKTQKSILIPVLKVIHHEEKEYAVMQFYHHGKMLSECIEELEVLYGRGCIPLKVQIKLLCTILESLQELHTCLGGSEGRGYLHLDLHPGNIFLENCDVAQGQYGMAKFLDFQNALKMDAEGKAKGSLTDMGVTPGFAAPEQCFWDRQSGCVIYTEASDLYGIAAIGARMFTGRGITDYLDTYLEIVEECILSGNNEGIFLGSEFLQILKLGLGVNPKYRFQSALSMKKYLYTLLERLVEADSGQYYQLFSATYALFVPLKQMSPQGMVYHPVGFHRAVRSLRNEMERQDHDTARSHYIFCALWNMREFFETQIPDTDIQELILCGIESYNYLGDSNHAVSLYDQLQAVQGRLPLMEYLKLNNIAAEFYIDTFRYETALSLMEKNKRAFEQIQQVYWDVAEENGLNPEYASWIKEQAKTYMNYGRYLAYLHREGGLAYLEKALKEFEHEEDDRQITLSHILHYAAEEKNQELFEAYAREYLGVFLKEKGAAEILRILMEHAEGGALWRLWIFLKGMYYFYMPSLSAQEKEYFCDLLCQLVTGSFLRQEEAYPVEHVYKYAAFILWDECKIDKGLKKTANRAFVSAITCPKTERIDGTQPLTIRMLMKYQVMAMYLDKTGEAKACSELRTALMEHSRSSHWDTLVTILEQGCPLSEMLGYEHC